MKIQTSLLLSLIPFLFVGCSDDVQEYTYKVYANAPVLRAVVEDANGQLAIQKDLTQNIYTFDKEPTKPIKAYSNNKTTFIDTNFDGNRTAFDVELDTTLYTLSGVITLVTTLAFDNAEYNSSSNEYNSTKYTQIINDMTLRYSLSSFDLESKTPLMTSNTRLAILSDTLMYSRSNSEYNASNLDAFATKFNSIEEFFTDYTTHLEASQRVKYHSSFQTLELLDKKVLTRAVENIMPSIPTYLNENYSNIENLDDASHLSSTYNSQSNLAYWAIKMDEDLDIAYVAAGNDGLDTVVTSSAQNRLENQNQNLNGFATAIETLDVNDARCIFVADQKNQVEIYGVRPLSNADNSNASSLLGSYFSAEGNATSFDVKYVNTNANNLEYLLVANGIKGLHIINVKDITCEDPLDLNDTHRVNSSAIGTDTHSIVASSNKKIIYVADGVNGLIALDISTVTPQVIHTLKLDANESAYNLHRTPNSNELYVSTDKGIQIFNTDDTGNVVFKGSYKTEGSRSNTLGETLRVSRSQNSKALFVADISGGIKVVDISDSTNPRLCGAGYFSAQNVSERSAVRDVILQEFAGTNDTLLVANDSNGLLKISNVSDLLFNHCKNLLD